jgi:hypothetical protein
MMPATAVSISTIVNTLKYQVADELAQLEDKHNGVGCAGCSTGSISLTGKKLRSNVAENARQKNCRLIGRLEDIMRIMNTAPNPEANPTAILFQASLLQE